MTVAFAICPAFALADGAGDNRAFSSDGHSYQMTCNDSGFVLTSDYPAARFIEDGVSSEVREGIETVFLGKSCDAFTEAYGGGTWGLANGGYVVTFDDYHIGFPRQEPRCERDADAAVAFEFQCPL